MIVEEGYWAFSLARAREEIDAAYYLHAQLRNIQSLFLVVTYFVSDYKLGNMRTIFLFNRW